MKALLILWIGIYALIGQVLLLRELLVILSGHELCLGILFASWLGGIFLGARVGGSVQKWIRNPRKACVGILTAAVVLAPVLVIATRQLRAWIPSSPGVPLPLVPTLAASIAMIAPMSFLIGFLFPVACRMAQSPAEGTVKAIGRVYVLEALGSIVAGVLLTYILLPWMDSFTILALGGLGILITCTAVMIHQASRFAVLLLCLCILWFLGMVGGGVKFLQNRSIQARWKAQHPGVEWLSTVDTQYQNLEMGRLEDQYTIFGNGHILTTFPDPHGAARMAHVVMNQRPGPQDVLIIGGGPGSLPVLVLQYPVRRVHIVQLDAEVLRLARPYLTGEELAAAEDARTFRSFMDGRYMVKKLPANSLDAVILQTPDPSTALLNRYHTLEFFQDVRRVLRPQGIVATSVTGSVNYIGTEVGGYIGGVYRTLKAVFPEVLTVPGDRGLLLASATPGMLTLDPAVLADRFQQQGRASNNVPPEIFSVWIQDAQISLWKGAVEAQKGPLNRDAHPVAYFHYLSLWELMSSRKFAISPLRPLMGLNFAWILALCALLILVALICRGPPERFRTPVIAIGITGFTGMAQEILCLYMYQALQGYLYSRLGLIVALFMGGLALGGWLGAKYCPESPVRALRALLANQAFILILCIAIPIGWVPAFFGTERLLLAEGLLEFAVGLWMFLVGLGTGYAFPVVCGLASHRDHAIGTVAGRVDAYDHLGAALGAILPGTFLVPIFGLAQTGIFLSALQFGAVLLLGVSLLDLKKASR
jgi:spermidine synthase